MLKQFVLAGTEEDPVVLLGPLELELVDATEAGLLVACSLAALAEASVESLPQGVVLQVDSADGFGTYLFREALVGRDASGALFIEYQCSQPNKYWEGRWGLGTLLDAVARQVGFHPEFSVEDMDLDDDWKRLTLRASLHGPEAMGALEARGKDLVMLLSEAEIALAGFQWKAEYDTNEAAFCNDVLTPLLIRMGFLSVRYTHGNREYGKDYTFSEMTSFGFLRHFGLQAKAGDVSGEASSFLDKLVGQADDAFRMPYTDVSSGESRFISAFVLAASGHFTENAKDKILLKVPRGLHGSLIFLDRPAITELAARYWRASG